MVRPPKRSRRRAAPFWKVDTSSCDAGQRGMSRGPVGGAARMASSAPSQQSTTPSPTRLLGTKRRSAAHQKNCCRPAHAAVPGSSPPIAQSQASSLTRARGMIVPSAQR
jgi:hypothetical protein